MISSSKLELAGQCPGAFTLPWRDEPNEHSDAGNVRHAGDETAINAGDVPDEYAERWPDLTWRAEVSYAYDVADGSSRFLGCGINRAYGNLSPFEVPGTIDAEGRGDDLLVVVDRKGFERQTPAESHPQLRFLTLAAARHQPAQRIIAAIRPEQGPMDVVDIDPVFDLDVIAYEVRQLVISTAKLRSDARAGRITPQFNTGRWCRWCPAFAACPRQADLRSLVVRDEDDPELALSTFVDDDAAANVYELWKRIGILHKRIGQQLYSHAATRPIQLPSGRAFGRIETLGNERLIGDTAYQVMKEIHGQEVADAAVVRSASKKKIQEALKSSGVSVAPAMRKVMSEIRSRGGASQSVKSSIEEYDMGPRMIAENGEE